MQIKVSLSIGYPTATHEDILDLDDDLTNEEIDEEVRSWAEEYLEIDWEHVENP